MKVIRSCEREIHNGIWNLKGEIDEFKESTKLKILEKKEQKALTFNNVTRLLEGRQKVLNGFESKIFPIKRM